MERYFLNTETGRALSLNFHGKMQNAPAKIIGELMGMPLKEISRDRFCRLVCPALAEAEIIDKHLDPPRGRRH